MIPTSKNRMQLYAGIPITEDVASTPVGVSLPSGDEFVNTVIEMLGLSTRAVVTETEHTVKFREKELVITQDNTGIYAVVSKQGTVLDKIFVEGTSKDDLFSLVEALEGHYGR